MRASLNDKTDALQFISSSGTPPDPAAAEPPLTDPLVVLCEGAAAPTSD